MEKKWLAAAAIVANLFCYPILADPSGDWAYIGSEQDGTDAKVYTQPQQIQNWGDENYFAPKLRVSKVTILGVDVADGNGGTWLDTSKPYRSMMTWAIYDCRRRMVAVSETHYFSDDTPSMASFVYMEKDGSPLLFPEIFPDPMLHYICDE